MTLPVPASTASTGRIRVKFLSKAFHPKFLQHWLARFPRGVPTWGACDYIFDPDCRDYEWLVVYDDLPRPAGRRFRFWEEPLPCPREHTLLITTEPSTIKVYGHRYTRQFGVVLTSQEPWALRHSHAMYRQPGLVWYYGATGHGNVVISSRGSYDSIVRNVPLNKTRLLSTVCSTKRQKHTLHHARVGFVNALQTALPELEVFGHGWNYLPDKADALDPYRFHVAIENHVCPHHWTEKLADAFLGLCLPFYHGCPNYADYFPAESVIPINIHDFEGSLDIIRRAARDEEDVKRRPALLESRRLYLERYWLFAQVAHIVSARHHMPSAPPDPGNCVCSRHLLRFRSPLGALWDGWEKLRVSFQHKLRGLD